MLHTRFISLVVGLTTNALLPAGTQKLEQKAKKTKESDAGATVARACGADDKQTTLVVCTKPVN